MMIFYGGRQSPPPYKFKICGCAGVAYSKENLFAGSKAFQTTLQLKHGKEWYQKPLPVNHVPVALNLKATVRSLLSLTVSRFFNLLAREEAIEGPYHNAPIGYLLDSESLLRDSNLL